MATAMSRVSTTALTMASSPMSDEEVVKRVRAGETALYEILMRRHNQRLYRAARSILGNDGEAEDVMQEAYVRAYLHLDQFDGRARFSTWLTKIAVHEALARCRQRCRIIELD
jgi:RNA polymerase sigma-70 factor, ECF subfamily